MSRPFVAYYRVSTDKQERSGLGLEAQQAAVAAYLDKHPDDVLIEEFTETESGANDERPILEEAIDTAKKRKAEIIVAKLDRLSRDVGFIANLQKRDVKFLACDYPDQDGLVVQLVSVVHGWEREQIGERTAAALKAAKARGTKLGTHNPKIALAASHGRLKSELVRVKKADLFAQQMHPFIVGLKAGGITTLAGIADALNERGVKPRRGRKFYAMTIANILKRSEAS
jgi:DNA invertase Pin-like site-specific DNA recombinase